MTKISFLAFIVLLANLNFQQAQIATVYNPSNLPGLPTAIQGFIGGSNYLKFVQDGESYLAQAKSYGTGKSIVSYLDMNTLETGEAFTDNSCTFLDQMPSNSDIYCVQNISNTQIDFRKVSISSMPPQYTDNFTCTTSLSCSSVEFLRRNHFLAAACFDNSTGTVQIQAFNTDTQSCIEETIEIHGFQQKITFGDKGLYYIDQKAKEEGPYSINYYEFESKNVKKIYQDLQPLTGVEVIQNESYVVSQYTLDKIVMAIEISSGKMGDQMYGELKFATTDDILIIVNSTGEYTLLSYTYQNGKFQFEDSFNFAKYGIIQDISSSTYSMMGNMLYASYYPLAAEGNIYLLANPTNFSETMVLNSFDAFIIPNLVFDNNQLLVLSYLGYISYDLSGNVIETKSIGYNTFYLESNPPNPHFHIAYQDFEYCYFSSYEPEKSQVVTVNLTNCPFIENEYTPMSILSVQEKGDSKFDIYGIFPEEGFCFRFQDNNKTTSFNIDYSYDDAVAFVDDQNKKLILIGQQGDQPIIPTITYRIYDIDTGDLLKKWTLPNTVYTKINNTFVLLAINEVVQTNITLFDMIQNKPIESTIVKLSKLEQVIPFGDGYVALDTSGNIYSIKKDGSYETITVNTFGEVTLTSYDMNLYSINTIDRHSSNYGLRYFYKYSTTEIEMDL